jgi:hypothetical protein
MKHGVEFVEDFTRLFGGYHGSKVVASATPFLCRGQILFIGEVKHNWPSQRQSRRWPQGFIEFWNGNRFSLADHKVSGTRVWLFKWTVGGDEVWAGQQAEAKLADWLYGCSDASELLAFSELLLGLLDRPKSDSRIPNYGPHGSPWQLDEARREIRDLLRAVGTRELRQLAALVSMELALPKAA